VVLHDLTVLDHHGRVAHETQRPIAGAGVAPERITLLCPPSASRQPWLDDLPDAFEEVRLEIHHPTDRKRLSYLATTREGKIKRIVSRNHPEIDEGWLCDKGRFGFTHLRAGDRVVDPGRRGSHRRYETLSWDGAIDEAESMLRAAGKNVVTALSGSGTIEQAYACPL